MLQGGRERFDVGIVFLLTPKWERSCAGLVHTEPAPVISGQEKLVARRQGGAADEGERHGPT